MVRQFCWLEEAIGEIPDGARVEITVRAAPRAGSPPGDVEILRSAGAWADDSEVDEIMASIHPERKLERGQAKYPSGG